MRECEADQHADLWIRILTVHRLRQNNRQEVTNGSCQTTNDPTVGLLCFRHSRLNYGSGVSTPFPFRLMTLRQRYYNMQAPNVSRNEFIRCQMKIILWQLQTVVKRMSLKYVTYQRSLEVHSRTRYLKNQTRVQILQKLTSSKIYSLLIPLTPFQKPSLKPNTQLNCSTSQTSTRARGTNTK